MRREKEEYALQLEGKLTREHKKFMRNIMHLVDVDDGHHQKVKKGLVSTLKHSFRAPVRPFLKCPLFYRKK